MVSVDDSTKSMNRSVDKQRTAIDLEANSGLVSKKNKARAVDSNTEAQLTLSTSSWNLYVFLFQSPT
jgi:hypothetical protein